MAGPVSTVQSIFQHDLVDALLAFGLLLVVVALWSVAMRRSYRQRTEQLEGERARLRTLVETIPDMVWLKDMEGIYQSCNPVFERYFGAPSGEIIGKSDNDFFPPEQAASFRAHDLMAIHGTGLHRYEEWATMARGGHRILFETIKTPVRDASGKAIGILGIARDITARKQAEERLRLVLKGSSDAPWDWDLEHNELYYSPQWWAMLGYSPDELATDSELWRRLIHPQDVAHTERVFGGALANGEDSYAVEFRLRHKDGSFVSVLSRGFISRDPAGTPIRVSGTNMDLSAQRRVQQIEELRSFMLEQISGPLALDALLLAAATRIEQLRPNSLCSIMLLHSDGQHLRLVAAPSLPEPFRRAVDGLAKGVGMGCCGHAVATGERSIAEDLRQHPHWANYREEALQAGLQSCWSEPIVTGDGQVLGSFAIYHRVPMRPAEHDVTLIAMAAHLLAIAIERSGAQDKLQLAARVFEQGGEGIAITDAERRIVQVNLAFSSITGYSADEVLGRDLDLRASGRHNQAFHDTLWSSVRTQGLWQGEIWNRRRDGSIYPEWLSISQVRDAHGTLSHYVAIFSDISQRKRDEESIRQLADYDVLTGLPNRRLFNERIAHAVSRAQRSGESLALMFIDLDRFKNINDSLGHHIGDELLVQVAKRLRSAIRDEDTVSRLGGDEFVLLFPGTDADGAGHVAEKLLELTAAPYALGTHELAITFSIGIAVHPSDGATAELLSMSADTAMYRAKQTGRNTYRFFTAEMQERSSRALLLENALRRALEHEQLQLHFQPQVALSDGRLVGAEALLRWHHPTLGQVSPAEFIPIAEDSGLIVHIGEWVLRAAVAQMRAWLDAGLPLGVVAVNLSAVQFHHANLPELVSRILTEHNLAPQHLELELTEGVAMNDPLGAIAVMDKLHQRGIRLSIDDFGTGYSSLSYLKRFQVYKLKIDQSFVRDISSDPDDKAIVSAIVSMARSLGFQTIAEGVETPAQLAFLRDQGCDEMQGYLFSRPLDAQAFSQFVRQHAQALEPQASP